MLIEIDDRSGFCFGVVRAISMAEEALAPGGEVFSLGDIVHNRVEVQRLEGLGLRTIRHGQLGNLAGRTVLIRAHGEPPATYEAASGRGIRLVDATCPVVARLQKIIKEAHRQMQEAGGQVVILGKRGHAEVVGLTDFARPIYLLSQTTQSLELFAAVRDEILRRAADPAAVTVNDTICRQVSNRNPHLTGFEARYDVVVFVSGSKSSNGRVLYEVCRAANSRTYKIEDESELEAAWFAGCRSVGICGATSTPKWLMARVADRIAAEFGGEK